MGDKIPETKHSAETLRQFTQKLLKDVEALEYMLAHDMFEEGARRIGAEQELVLIDQNWRPAPIALEMLKELNDDHFTAELALFNLEFNLDPLPFGGNCLRQIEGDLQHHMVKAIAAAKRREGHAGLFGILPTVRKSDLTLANMTPETRYRALNDTLTRMRGKEYSLDLKGIDELSLTHDNVMLEACNTSFQVHFQVDVAHFAHRYNIAQAVTAPVLAAAVNSPMLGRYRLWHETRIALFQQSLDTRTGPWQRRISPRVNFGTKWVNESVLELIKEDIGRFKVLFGVPVEEDPFEALDRGDAPSLKALRLHNGTVYRWNRVVYGAMNGQPNLRIENRVIPSGPTILDEVANASFWFGLMAGLGAEYNDIRSVMDFDDCKNNFYAAARHGLTAQFRWLRGKVYPAQDVILQELLPLARSGLQVSGIDASDIDRYLGVIEERVSAARTGSQWLLDSHAALRMRSAGEISAALTASSLKQQQSGKPVHEWELASLDDTGRIEVGYQRVDQFMSTDLFTVHPDDHCELAAKLMLWNRVRHVMVEDDQHQLVGLVSHRALLRLLGTHVPGSTDNAVSHVMISDPVSVSPETSTVEAIELMRKHQISCLPVIKDQRLVGVVTEDSFLRISATLLDELFTGDRSESRSPAPENH